MATGSRTRRGLILTGLGATGAALLSACSPRGAGGEGAASPSSAPVTVQFMTDHFGGARYETVKAAVAHYKEERPNATVDLRNLEEGGGRAAHLAAGTIGDLVLWGGNFQEFVVRNVLLDVTPYTKSLRLRTYEDWVAPEYFKEATSFQGKQYGFPYQYITNDWKYNRTWLQRLGVKEPDESWTLDAFADAAAKLTERDSDRWGGQSIIINPPIWAPIIRAYGGDLFTPDLRRTALGDAPASDGWEYLLSWMQPRRISPSPNDATARALKFVAGHFAFDQTTYMTRDLDKQIGGAFEWASMPPPKHPKTGTRSVLANMQPHMITIAARERGVAEETVRFGSYMSGEYVNGLIADLGNQMPFHKRVADTDRFLPAAQRKWQVYGNPFRKGLDLNPGWSAWWSAIQAPLKAGLNGEIAPRTMAQRLKDEGNAAMEQAYAEWDALTAKR